MPVLGTALKNFVISRCKKNTVMEKRYDLDGFVDAQRETYGNALREI